MLGRIVGGTRVCLWDALWRSSDETRFLLAPWRRLLSEAAEEEVSPTSRIEEGVEFAWKWDARCHVWSLLEAQDLARSPRPVYHRVPNFHGSNIAATALSQLELFTNATSVAVGPENAQMNVRELVLKHKKTLYVPRPRLRDGFFSRIGPEDIGKNRLASSVTTSKIRQRGTVLPFGAQFKLDLLVMGSVAVDGETGARVGNGDGLAELEYSLLRMCGAIDAQTKVVTTVHDVQIQDCVKMSQLAPYDVPIDVIVTPTRIIYTQPTQPKPDGLLWHLLSPQKLAQIPLLWEIKTRLEAEAGGKLPTGNREELPPAPFYEFGRRK